MKHIIIQILAMFMVIPTIFAQDQKAAVKATVDKLFDGMRNSDSLLIKTVFHEDCTLKTVAKNETGETILEETGIAKFVKSVGTKRPGVQLDERLSNYEIMIDGEMATAWTPYKFYVNDKFSHCGVNTFTLIKQTDGWKIISITDTRRKENCL